MLGALVDVPDLGIAEARVIAEIHRIGGYVLYKVQFNPKDGEINPSVITAHEHEMEVVDSSEIRTLDEPEFQLGDLVRVRNPINVEGIVSGIVYSSSGCVEYEVDYKTDRGVVVHIFAGPLLEKLGQAAMAGSQSGSMIRSVERRA